jgi:hypothetical protein
MKLRTGGDIDWHQEKKHLMTLLMRDRSLMSAALMRGRDLVALSTATSPANVLNATDIHIIRNRKTKVFLRTKLKE